MGKIQKLDTQLANMIAAGEVVERPMGIVKELVENAIDAESKTIVVTIEEGGIQKITVQDDGIGMDASDAELAFARHATSKIKKQNDLWNIQTLGFRGEALPSIASVSKVTLSTSDGNESTRIIMEYGERISAGPYPCNQGTEITVEGLFFRTPARLKHMRAAAYESSLVQNVVNKFALSYPDISFRLISDGKEAFYTTGKGDLLEVLFQIYGRSVAENAIPVSFEDMDYKVEGYLINPSITRASRNMIHIFLNGRMVHTYRLHKAVQDGYEDFIVKGRYPIAILKIEMDPHLLDVNVHPSKWEVRLSKENQLEYLIKEQIHKVLQGTLLAPKAELEKSRIDYYQPISFDENQLKPTEPKVYYKQESLSPPPITYVEEVKSDAQVLQEIQDKVAERKEVYDKQMPAMPDMQVIGQLHDKFILCACEDGLAIIDQHAAQERVHFEEYNAKLNQDVAMMDCLVPITLHVTNDIVRRVDEVNESIQDLHVTFEPFGTDTLLVRQVPSWMSSLEEQAFLEDVLDNFKNDRESKYTKMEKKAIATMACHHSIRFHRSLTMDEMKEVVRQLKECENPYHCPHGRPTFIILEENELTKEFLR